MTATRQPPRCAGEQAAALQQGGDRETEARLTPPCALVVSRNRGQSPR